MHTAICTFEDRPAAEQAVQRLQQAGFAPQEIHLEHRHPDGSPMRDERGGDPPARPGFFERLFRGGHASHARTYERAVDAGLYVVLVESADETRAARAQEVLHGMNPADVSLVHRAGGRPLHDVVGEHLAGDLERAFGMARGDMGRSHNEADGREKLFPREERAVAARGDKPGPR